MKAILRPELAFLLFFICFGSVQLSWGQDSLPKNYFAGPLDIPLRLAGTFAELRPNHFHSGLDIKTQQRTGLTVKAAAGGYVSRIKISSFGYGKAIYIQHPNGYTTVYGHLKELAPKLRQYVRKRQYKKERFNLDLFPQKSALPVNQGAFIAKSGQTGGAAGPHVHFEIRDKDFYPMNPLNFGIHINDHRPPVIQGLYVYPSGEKSHANHSAKRQNLHLTKQKDGSYKTETVYAHGKLGFGVNAIDHTDKEPNPVGLYNIKASLNGNPRYNITFSRFSFPKSRYINRFIDYAAYKDRQKRIQKLFMQPNNDIDFPIKTHNKGYIELKDSLDYTYKITLQDYAGNQTVIRVPLKGQKVPQDKIEPKVVDTTDYYAYSGDSNVFDLEHHDIYIPKGALYEDQYLDIKDYPDKVKVHNKLTPLQKKITIGFDAGKYHKKDREKLYVARTYPWGGKVYSKTLKEGDRITTRTNIFGTYKLAMDTTPPTIEPANFYKGKWMSKAGFLKVKINDNESGIASYRGTINGKFIAMQYDYKTHILKYDFRDRVSNDSEKKLKIIVVDNVGNSKTFKSTVYRGK